MMITTIIENAMTMEEQDLLYQGNSVELEIAIRIRELSQGFIRNNFNKLDQKKLIHYQKVPESVLRFIVNRNNYKAILKYQSDNMSDSLKDEILKKYNKGYLN